MPLDFRRASLPQDAAELHRMDVEIFGDDAYTQDYWLTLEPYWVLSDGCVVGCTAFISNVDFQEDLDEDKENVPQEGTLYIQTTGLLPRHQGHGFGNKIKFWQIEFAKQSGFKRIVTNCRKSNSKMISVNRKYGFTIIRTTPGYYEDGEATVVMELVL